jgi:tetratricopeptide (TPR) repeat protein
VAFSPDGSQIVSGDKAQTVRLWDVKSGKELHRWDTAVDAGRARLGEGTIWCVAFTPDGAHVVAGGSDGDLRLWDVKSGKVVQRFHGHQGRVRCVGFLPNSQRMISGDNSGNLIVWDLQTGQALARMKQPGARAGLAVVPGGGHAVTADGDRLVRVWPLSSEIARAHAARGELAQADAIYTQAFKDHPEDTDLRLERARILARNGKWQRAADDFSEVLKSNATSWQLWADRSHCLAMSGETDKAAADLAKAAELGAQAVTKNPDDRTAADFLTEILLQKIQSKWTPLQPLSAKSDGGATLTVQRDGSVLASGARPKTDVYRITTALPNGKYTALRVEALPDESLPSHGPGRAFNGNFVLSELVVTVTRPGGQPQRIRFRAAAASFEQKSFGEGNPYGRWTAAAAIDGDAHGKPWGWAVLPEVGQRHEAVFEFTEALSVEGATLSVEVHQNFVSDHTLGRFRISLTEDDSPARYLSWTAATPLAKVGAAYLAAGDARGAADFLTTATAANPRANPADWLVLAVARARLKEPDQAKKACARATELLKPAGADFALRPLVREVILVMGPNLSEVTNLIAATGGAPPEALNDAIRQNPENAVGYRNRGNWYGERALWKEASADYAEAFRLEPDTLDAMKLGLLLAHAGETDRYRKHAQAVLDRWAPTEKNKEADQALKTALFLADSKCDPKKLAKLAEAAVSGDKDQEWYEWFLFAKGLHDYRTGKYADSLEACRESRRRAPASKGQSRPLTAMCLAIEAMALKRTNDEAGAKRALAEAKSELDSNLPGFDTEWWNDWLAARMFYREAEGLLAGKKAAQPMK